MVNTVANFLLRKAKNQWRNDRIENNKSNKIPQSNLNGNLKLFKKVLFETTSQKTNFNEVSRNFGEHLSRN